MKVAAAVTRLLTDRLGLSPELLGPTSIERALGLVLGKVAEEERAEWTARLLQAKGEEWQTLIEEVDCPGDVVLPRLRTLPASRRARGQGVDARASGRDFFGALHSLCLGRRAVLSGHDPS